MKYVSFVVVIDNELLACVCLNSYVMNFLCLWCMYNEFAYTVCVYMIKHMFLQFFFFYLFSFFIVDVEDPINIA